MDAWRTKYNIEKPPSRKSKGKENQSLPEKAKG